MIWMNIILLGLIQGALTEATSVHNSTIVVESVDADLGTEYFYMVNSTKIYMFNYKYNISQIGTGAIRIYVESLRSKSRTPVLVVVRHEKGVLSWQLPLLLEKSGSGGHEEYPSVNRTLCPIDDYSYNRDKENRLISNGEQHISVSLSTASNDQTKFKLIVYIQEDFQVSVNETRTFQVTPSAPQYFQFDFPDDMNIAIINMESEDKVCMTMSVQNISCPVADLDRNIEFEGIWQTVDSRTGMTIRRELFPLGLHIVFVVKPDDNECTNSFRVLRPRCLGPCRNKKVSFTITEKITKDEYIAATFGAFAMFLGAYITVILVSCIICVRKSRLPQDFPVFETFQSEPKVRRPRYGSISSTSTNSTMSGTPSPSTSHNQNISGLRHNVTEDLDEIQRVESPVPRSEVGGLEQRSQMYPSQSLEDPVLEDRDVPDGMEDTHSLCSGHSRHSVQSVHSVHSARSARSGHRVHRAQGVLSDQNDHHEEEGQNIEQREAAEESLVDETEYDLLRDADEDKDVFRTKTFLFVSDLARKHPVILARRSMQYHWNLLTISIFYGLPVVQLVVTYQQVLNQTGNEDLCYYNFLCAHPLGLLSDFNHVYSNLGYVMLGGLFMVFVWRRDFMYKRLSAENPQIVYHFGIPQHSGLFYAMGLALIMEGLMSGCYHICPNHSNFQFDTAFMYTIAILCMLKIYQFRHPDINANAYTAFGVLAFVILIGMMGVTNSSIPFWIFFTGCHVITCLILSTQIYYMGRWKIDSGIFKRIWLTFYNDVRSLLGGSWHAFKPTYPDRMILLIIFNLINWGLSIYGVLVMAQNDKDFASFLLGVFIINLLLYTLFYILMKLRSGERICRQALTYILLASLCWAPAMFFFLNKSTTWNLSAAQSRHYNQTCRLFHFYDNHDIWHFLSATALFLSFMVLLTIDDDLSEKKRDRIPVF